MPRHFFPFWLYLERQKWQVTELKSPLTMKVTKIGWSISPLIFHRHNLYVSYIMFIFDKVFPQVSCGDICQIWTWFKGSNIYCCKIWHVTHGNISKQIINTLRLRQKGGHFAYDIFKLIFSNKNVWIPIKISPKFVLQCTTNNVQTLVQIMAWCRPGDKPLSESMTGCLLTHICITQPQWVNTWKLRQNVHHIPDIFKCIFFNEYIWISINISLQFFS